MENWQASAAECATYLHQFLCLNLSFLSWLTLFTTTSNSIWTAIWYLLIHSKISVVQSTLIRTLYCVCVYILYISLTGICIPIKLSFLMASDWLYKGHILKLLGSGWSNAARAWRDAVNCVDAHWSQHLTSTHKMKKLHPNFSLPEQTWLKIGQGPQLYLTPVNNPSGAQVPCPLQAVQAFCHEPLETYRVLWAPQLYQWALIYSRLSPGGCRICRVMCTNLWNTANVCSFSY